MSEDLNKKSLAPETPTKLSTRHLAFVEDYLLHFNASQAYSKVYPATKGHSLAACASQLLTRIDVQQYLQRRLAERKAQLNVDASYVVRKLTEIVEADFVNSTQFLTKHELDKIPENIRKLIQSIEIQKQTNRGENFDTTTEKYKVTFMSKDAAINALGKHTGAFMKDNVSGQYNLDQMTFTDALKQLDI